MIYIYLQLSRHEAFGLSIVEAMTYNCIPIVLKFLHCLKSWVQMGILLEIRIMH